MPCNREFENSDAAKMYRELLQKQEIIYKRLEASLDTQQIFRHIVRFRHKWKWKNKKICFCMLFGLAHGGSVNCFLGVRMVL